MPSEGPNLPSTGADDSSVGTGTWVNPGSVTADDGSNATVTAFSAGQVTHYLKATDFGFSIPSGATIDGIVVVWERLKSGNGGSNIQDNAVRIVKGGAIGSTDKSAGGNWPTSTGDQSYGGASDLWGETWTDSDINASDFGAALSAKDSGGGGTNAAVDKVTITVHYTESGTPVSQTQQVSHEAAGDVDGTLASAMESAGPVSAETESEWEALESATNSATHAYASGVSPRATRQTRHEAAGFIGFSVQSSHEAAGTLDVDQESGWESLVSPAATLETPIEAIGKASQTAQSPHEAAGTHNPTQVSGWESLLAVSNDAEAPHEALVGLSPSQVSAVESEALVSSTATSRWENLLSGSQTFAAPWEAAALATAEMVSAWEGPGLATQSTVTGIESSGVATQTLAAAWAALGIVTQEFASGWESLEPTAVQADQVTAWESSAPISQTNAPGWESSSSVIGPAAQAFEALGISLGTGVGAWESSGILAGTAAVAWAALGIIDATMQAGWESSQLVTADDVHGWESSAPLVRTSANGWESSVTFAAQGDTAFEALGVVSLAVQAGWEALAQPSAATETWYFRNTAGVACGPGTVRALSRTAGSGLSLGILIGADAFTFNRTESVRSLAAGTWRIMAEIAGVSGLSTRMLVERRNSACVVQETILDQTVSTPTSAEYEFSQNVSAITFAAGDVLTIRVSSSGSSSNHRLRYDGAASGSFDSRLIHPAVVPTGNAWESGGLTASALSVPHESVLPASQESEVAWESRSAEAVSADDEVYSPRRVGVASDRLVAPGTDVR